MEETKPYSRLGKLVRDWESGMRLDDPELLEYCLKRNIDPNKIQTKREVQSLCSRYVMGKTQKDRKNRKDTQEIDDTPPKEQEEQDQAHGGEEDQHDDIEDAEDENNEGGQPSESQEEQDQDNQESSDGSSPRGDGNADGKEDQDPSLKQQAETMAQANQEHNETLKQQLKQLQQQFGDTDNEKSEKSEVTLAQNTSRRVGYGGGGARMDDAKGADLATFRAIQEFLLKLSSDESPMGKLEGREKWDPVKLVKSRFNPAKIPNARFSRPRERRIWFIVDDSGSVSRFAEFIVSMIQGAASVVNVVHGSEAKPCHWIKLPRVNRPKALSLWDLERFETWTQEFDHSFLTCLATFIKECKVMPGDVLVFWGDLMDACESSQDSPALFRKLLRKYKCYWLLSHDGTDSYYGNDTWLIEESKAFNMFYDVNNAQALRKAIKKIK